MPLKLNWKDSGKTLAPLFDDEEIAMYRAYAEAVTFTVLYRGYTIEVAREPFGWRAGVYPRSADLPILGRQEVHAWDQDAAVIEAKRRVDRVLN